jgi:pyrroline-5-carboxylate reductase
MSNNDPEKLPRIRAEFGHELATTDPREAARFERLIVVATPPGEVMPVLGQILPELSPNHVVISLAAGVTLAMLESLLGEVPVVRVMPNTPALVGEAMNLVVFGRTVSPAARADIEKLLEVLGGWHVVEDGLSEWGA